MSPSFLKSKFWGKNKCNSNPFPNRAYLENYSTCIAFKAAEQGCSGQPLSLALPRLLNRSVHGSTPYGKLCYIMRSNKNLQTIVCITSEAGDALEPERLMLGSAWLCDLGPLCASILTSARELLWGLTGLIHVKHLELYPAHSNHTVNARFNNHAWLKQSKTKQTMSTIARLILQHTTSHPLHSHFRVK